MGKTARQLGKVMFRYGRRVVPVLISAGLIVWLVWTVTPRRLANALTIQIWPWLVLITFLQVAILFLWDTFSLWWLFSQSEGRLPFRTVLRARTDSILWSAVNLEIGQGVFAAKLAAVRKETLTAALGKCLVLALFDTGSLMTLAVVGSFVKPDPLTQYFRWPCLGILLGLFVLAAVLHWLPQPALRWLRAQDWASWLSWWTWRRSFLLAIQRLGLFLLVLLYAGVGLRICHVPVDVRTVVGVVPFVLVAEAIPGTGGIGERETALVYLLGVSGDERAELLSFGLIWSAGTILGRILIGLTSAWLPRREQSNETDRSARAPAS